MEIFSLLWKYISAYDIIQLNKLRDSAFVDSVCAKNNISKETLLLFAEIADFRKR